MFDSLFGPKEPKDACVGCHNLRNGNEDATQLHKDLQATNKKIDAAPTTGSNYADLAEIYLKSALRHAENHDWAGALIMLDGGPRAQQRHPDGSHINADGVRNALEMAAKHGADTSRLAITASAHVDEHTHIELVRYGKGSNAMFANALVQFGGGGRIPRWARWLGQMVRHPLRQLRISDLRNASERGLFLLVMQTHDNSLRTTWKDGPRGGHLSTEQRAEDGNPGYIPQANETARVLAEEMGGMPFSTLTELAGVPVTAHFIGGCAIGDSPETGVIDPYQRVYGYEGLHVADGSALTANQIGRASCRERVSSPV